MRARINNGQLDVDLIKTQEQMTNVIKLALAAGLTDFRSYRNADNSLGLLFSPADGAWAAAGFASLLIVTAALNGVQANTLIEQFHSNNPGVAAAVEAFVPAAQTS